MKSVSLFNDIFGDQNFDYQKIKENDRLVVEDSSFLKFITSIPVLEEMSFLMEEIAIRYAKKADMYVGFQKLSRAEAVWPRYQEVSRELGNLFVFGENDCSLKKYPRTNLIYLPEGHPLVKEWFLVIDFKKAKSMLTAYDLDGFGKFENEKERRFKGIKSNNPRHVNKAVRILKSII